MLFAYGSGSPDPAQVAAFVASKPDRIQILLAHRPNVSYPTYAAKTFATLDQVPDGHLTVQVITDGNDREQTRQGDRLAKDKRYSRTREYLQIVKRAWTSGTSFVHHGEHYRFDDFASDVLPVQQPRPNVSFAGLSPVAYAEADIYCLWGEPLARTAVIPIVCEEVNKRDEAKLAVPAGCASRWWCPASCCPGRAARLRRRGGRGRVRGMRRLSEVAGGLAEHRRPARPRP
ncbi:alkanesulfonate monooxygenase SsuD/methylene tetrahydromethanopterin reductase-like flavin-dependent oxidoreductase (luciferase family) [Crossiella equi]|uniref:Alkanesulfonate monooxygenase SsuD/methylene tetrahydromethanopterin reductase-like flavin-dependent oxidoreductase (Luciferase family) n=1 Tax=Crossiella equi TaxID=130796 RepID=A0ABS5ALK3_9PSEU|nr:LLM class flavin-dependent oxidoreductase [Crossiella equi]MBP2477431.1 alkanesulfonate monooxygenase SsuD/methylene tetrahydromethanopterin reductase-like flavin-dependent oxidoreductase (luciferase family) [Crossiella equi]